MATAVPVTRWDGCYGDSWQDLIVPEAFAHPAKFSRGLIHRIYRHLLEQGHLAPGTTVLDPFGGVALGALDAMTYGLRYIGVELEPRFVELGNKNLELWRQRYNFTQGTLVQGDSRQLRSVLAGAQVQAVVGSPPYVESLRGAPITVDARRRERLEKAGYVLKSNSGLGADHSVTLSASYGTTPGQLGAMSPGTQVRCVVSSPPYEGSLNAATNGIDRSKMTYGDGRPLTATSSGPLPQTAYGTTPGQLGAMPPGAVVSSPPYEGSLDPANGGHRHKPGFTQGQTRGVPLFTEGYGQSLGQLELERGDTFWSASAQIMQELALLLPAGAVCAWVVKAYVKNKQIVPFPEQWLALTRLCGFRLVEEIHASLVEDHGTQEGLFGDSTQVRTEKKSFFRRLAEKKGSPRIDHETVLIMKKAGSGAGVCCVSSPPFQGSLSGGDGVADRRDWFRDRLTPGGKIGQSCNTDYGTTPGNLGNLPVGRR